ncbi:ubiquinol-cytochrome-c reductase complex assembly factor 1-like protein [Tanacetum coccineum]
MVNLLFSKCMRELEKVFYANIVAFDTAMLPEANPDDLQTGIWNNVLKSTPVGAKAHKTQVLRLSSILG